MSKIWAAGNEGTGILGKLGFILHSLTSYFAFFQHLCLLPTGTAMKPGPKHLSLSFLIPLAFHLIPFLLSPFCILSAKYEQFLKRAELFIGCFPHIS